MKPTIIKITNLDENIRFSKLKEIFKEFGRIEKFCIIGETYYFDYLKHENALNAIKCMHLFTLGRKKMVVEWSSDKNLNFVNYEDLCCQRGVRVFNYYQKEKLYLIDEIKMECAKYGLIEEIRVSGEEIIVICKDKSVGEKVFENLDRRWYDGKRIECKYEEI